MTIRARRAEVYGMLTGVLAAGETAESANDLCAQEGLEAGELAADLASKMLAALRAQGFTLPKTLTDTSLALGLRVAQLAAWTRGFLSGLGQAGERLLALGDQGEQLLADLDAISHGAQLEGDSDAPACADEARALSELQAYLCNAAEFFYRALARA